MAQPLHMSRMFGQDLKAKFHRPGKACLLCYREYSSDILRARHRDSMDSFEMENNQNAFTIFCKILDVDPNTYTDTWDFSNEGIPFCASCTSLACRLSSLYDELGVIQQEIILNTKVIKATMLQSQDRSARRMSSDRRVDTFRREVFSIMQKVSSKNTFFPKYEDEERYDEEQEQCRNEQRYRLANEHHEREHHAYHRRDQTQPAYKRKDSGGSRLVPVPEFPVSPNLSNVEFYKESDAIIPEKNIKKERDAEEPYDLVRPNGVSEAKRKSLFAKNDVEIFEIEESTPLTNCEEGKNNGIKQSSTIAEYGKLLESQLRIQQSYNQHFKQGPQFPLPLLNKPPYFHPTFRPSPPFDHVQNLPEAQVSYEKMAEKIEAAGSPPYYLSSSPHESHHMTPPDSPTNQGMHNCQVCGKQYSKPYQLKAHLRLHTGEKPYRCNVCSKTFRLAGNLRVHTRIHTGETPYECQFCGKRCTQKSQLNTHVLIHHKKSEQLRDGSQ